MKTILKLIFTFSLLASISFNANAFSYYVSFTGSGASTAVDSVVVQNLYKGTQVKVPAGSQLRLYDVETSIDLLNTISDFACVYPNPMTGDATYSFVAKNEGNTKISVYGLDGRKVAGIEMNLKQGKNTFELTLPKGVYLVQAKGNGFSYTTRTISLSMTEKRPIISFGGNASVSKIQIAPAAEVNLQYSPGDQILYKGYSGNYCTIVTDKPTETKTTNFKFVECTDVNGNHYAVVHIGEQTWMAENLRTTKYRTEVEIGTTTSKTEDIRFETEPKYQWAYNGEENNLAKYGRLYTWYAVADARNIAPAGWHVAADTEWTTLENYLIANGYNHDGTTTGNKIAKSLASTTDWATYSTTGTIGSDLSQNNKSGFNAMPGGTRFDEGTFLGIVENGYWWSSTEIDNSLAWYRHMSYSSTDQNRFSSLKGRGCSVRCVRGETSNPLNIQTTLIPSGTFNMGSPVSEIKRDRNETQFSVTLSTFSMSKYEITNSQYAAFLNAKSIGIDGKYVAGAYPTQILIYASCCSYDWGLHYTNNKWVPVVGYENHPAINVTWYGASEFATYSGGTLPTEAQWEYACRAGTTTPFNTGEFLTNLQANYDWAHSYNGGINTITTYPGKTQAVGNYAPNAYGLYDMHGNVVEWCSDWYGTYPTTAQNNPSGPSTGNYRVFRGGSWLNYGEYCRSAQRTNGYPFNLYNVGFRIVFVP